MDPSKKVYFGIDISTKTTLISIYKQNMEEPVTVSTVLGAQNFAIPTVVAKKNGISQWYFGEEAVMRSRNREAACVEELLTLAVRDEETLIEG